MNDKRDADRHPSERQSSRSHEGVRIVKRDEVEVDLRDDGEQSPRIATRNPWPSMSKITRDDDDPIARFPLPATQGVTTPFLRPLSSVIDDADFDEIDLRDHDNENRERLTEFESRPVHEQAGQSSTPTDVHRSVSTTVGHRRAEASLDEMPNSDVANSDVANRDGMTDGADPADVSNAKGAKSTAEATEAADAASTADAADGARATGATEPGFAASNVQGEKPRGWFRRLRENNAELSRSEDHSDRDREDTVGAANQSANQFDSTSTVDSIVDAIDAPTTQHFQKSSLATRVITGVVAAAIALVAFMNGPTWVMALAVAVLVGAAMEFFDGVRAAGFRPATALGILSVAGMSLGAYARGEAAIAVVLSLAVVFTFLWFITGIVRTSPTANIAVTLLGVTWIGVFGSFAALLLRAPNHNGIAFLTGAVLTVVAYDTAAYLGGSVIGRRKLAPYVSPSKTIEGALVGTVASIAVGAIVLPFVHPWGVVQGALLGLVVAIVAPIGDLGESIIKRDIGVKDMGRILPGHGGVLDRFDAFLMVLPVTYFLVMALDLL